MSEQPTGSSVQYRMTVLRSAVIAIALFLSFAAFGFATGIVRSAGVIETIVFTSIAASFSFVAAVIAHRRIVIVAAATALLLPSLVYVAEPYHIGIIVLSCLIVYRGLSSIREDMRTRIRIMVAKSVSVGVFSIAFALSLALSSAYYSQIRDLSWEALVPEFSFGRSGGDIVAGLASFLNIGDVSTGTTVGEFIRGARPPVDDFSGLPDVVDRGLGLMAPSARQEIIAEANRAMEAQTLSEFSDLIGREVRSDEVVSDVIVEAIRNKLVAILAVKRSDGSLPASSLPLLIAVLFFITVLSVAAILKAIWVVISATFIRAAIASGLVLVRRIPAEQEILE